MVSLCWLGQIGPLVVSVSDKRLWVVLEYARQAAIRRGRENYGYVPSSKQFAAYVQYVFEVPM